MAQLNLPFGIYRATRGDLDLKFRVEDDSKRDELITLDLVELGHIIFNKGDGKHYSLKTYPTFGNLTGVEWEEISSKSDVNLQGVLDNGRTWVSDDSSGVFTIDPDNGDGYISYTHSGDDWGYTISAEEGLFFTDGSGNQNGSSALPAFGGVIIGNRTHSTQINSFNITANRILELPDSSGTIALVDTNNNFSVDQTFQGNIKVNTIEVPNKISQGVDDDTAWIHFDTSGSNGGNDSGVTIGKRASEDDEMGDQPYLRIRSNGAYSMMTENISANAPWAQSIGVYEGYGQADKLANFGFVGQGTDAFYLSYGFRGVNGGGPSWWNGQSYLLMHKTGKVEFGQDVTGGGTSVKTESQSEPNAKLVLARGTTDDAPLLFKSGDLLSTTRNGTIEYSSSDGKFYFTQNGVRSTFDNLSATATSDNEDSISLMPYNISLASFKIGYEDGLKDGVVGVNGDVAFRVEFSGVSKDAIKINRQSGDVSFVSKLTAPNLGIADITDPKDLTTKEYVESLQGKFELKTDSTTSITLSSSDKGKVISADSSSAITFTVDTSSLTDIGDIAYVDQIGSGEITFVAGSGVTLQYNSSRELKTDGQFSRVAIHKTGTTTYRVFGELK